MGNLAKRLAKKLLELRGEAPQYHFARRLGISKSSLNRIEIGDQNVSLKTLGPRHNLWARKTLTPRPE